MAAQKLSATKIEKYKPAKNDELLPDGNGLYIRFRLGISGALSRFWICTYKVGAKSVYLTLGDYHGSLSAFEISIYNLDANAKLTLETARKISAEIADWRKKGTGPKEFLQSEMRRFLEEEKSKAETEVLLKKQHDSENLTVQDLFEAWISDGVRRKDGNAELSRSFQKDVLPEIGNQPVRSVTEHDIRALLRKMVDRGVNRLAVVTCGNLTQMFLWAEKRQPWRKLLTEGNPVQLVEIEKIVDPDYDMTNERDRLLSFDEIIELHGKFSTMRTKYENADNKRTASRPVQATTELAIWIMLSTLCRVGELTMSRWEHVNLETGEWFIPRENTKGNKSTQSDLTIFLSQFALNQFCKLHKITGHTNWCFPASHNDEHVCVKSMSKQVGDRQTMFKKDSEGNPRKTLKNRTRDANILVLSNGENGEWTPHDLRRTGATMMQRLGVSLEIIDRCQNHVLPGSKTRRHYMHHDYAIEKRTAWQLIGNQINQLIGGAD